MDVILFISTFILFHQQQFQCRWQTRYFYYERKGIKIESKWNIHDWIELRLRYLWNPGKLFKGMNNVIIRYFFSNITYAFNFKSSSWVYIAVPITPAPSPFTTFSLASSLNMRRSKHKTSWIHTWIKLMFQYLRFNNFNMFLNCQEF